MASDPQRVQCLFLAAVEQSDPAARRAFLAQECGDDAELRRRVEELLAAHDASGSFLDSPAVQQTGSYLPDTADSPDPTACVGTVLAGKYKLIEEIGSGGMGSVWMAQQTEPVRRVVAVKVIKAGMDSKAVLARFEAERQALALMDHTNIARVLDAGATPDGRPFFVMELVKGVPITQFCDERKLTPRQRLALFIPVCQAIQHAHQKGVIHRDIKPSNVLVALYDDKPVPKVIDFGVAKATGQTLTERTLVTGFGAVVGTPEYMSPEQANLNNLDIDTRSDVYALGVLLYELLTGTPPFSRKELEKAGLLEILRLIREQEPQRPSTRLSSADTPASVSAARGSEQGHLAKQVRGEVDWITMKALEKDRARRYGSAADLAADVERYLRDEPVEACPPSWAYRAGKFLRKHKAALTLASTAAILLLVGAGVSTCLAWWAISERDKAIAVGIQEAEQRQKAQEATVAANSARLATRRAFYAQSMTLIPLAWEADEVGRVAGLLDGLRPGPDDEDLRGFEWHYWDRQLHQERRATPIPGDILSGDWCRVVKMDSKPWDSGLKVVDVASGKVLLSLPERKCVSGRVILNHDGSRLALVRSDPLTEDECRLMTNDRRTGRIANEKLLLWVEVWDVTGDGKNPVFSQKSDTGAFLSCATFSPDGKRLLTVEGKSRYRDLTLKVWDPDGNPAKPIFTTEVASFGGYYHFDRFQALPWAFSPDGTRLALRTQVVVGPGGGAPSLGVNIDVWEITGGKRAASLKVGAEVRGLAFSPDGKKLAGVGWDLEASNRVPSPPKGPIRTFLWEGAGGAELKEVRSTPVNSLKTTSSLSQGAHLTYSPDGRLLAVHGDHVLCLLDAATGAEKRVLKAGIAGPVKFAEGGKVLQAVLWGGLGDDTRTLCEWDLATSSVQDIARPGGGDPQEVTVRSRTGERQASYTTGAPKGTNIITIRDRAGKVVRTHTSTFPFIQSLAISPSGRFVLSSSWDGGTQSAPGVFEVKSGVQLWDMDTGNLALSSPGGYSAPGRLCHSPDGEIVLGGGGPEVSLPTSPDGRLVLLHNEADIQVLDLDRASILSSVPGADTAHFSHDSRWLVTGHTKVKTHKGVPGQIVGEPLTTVESYEIKVWDVQTGKQVPRSYNSSNTRIAVSRDGCFLAQQRGDDEAVLLDVGSGETLFTLRGKDAFGDFSDMLFSPDRTMLVTSFSWAEHRLWDLINHRERFRFTVGVGRCNSLAFTPDSKRLAGHVQTNATPPEFKLWDCATGNELLRLVSLEWDTSAPGCQLSFTPDGHRLILPYAMHRSGPITRTWDATPREEPQR